MRAVASQEMRAVRPSVVPPRPDPRPSSPPPRPSVPEARKSAEVKAISEADAPLSKQGNKPKKK